MGPTAGRPYLLVRARVDAGRLDEFRRWHHSVHVPHVLAIPGIVEAIHLRAGVDGPNSLTAYIFQNDAAIQPALSSSEAARARADWQAWLPHLRDLSIQIYTRIGAQPALRHWN